MLTLYKTNTTKDASNYVFNCLKRVEKTNLDIQHTIIVPDRASHEAERQLLNSLGGSFNVQVLTFRRFANIVLPQYKYLTKQSGIIALSAIISDNKDQLTCFTKGHNNIGFAQSVYETICQLKYCKISPEMLLSKQLGKGVEGKIKDIQLLYSKYQQFLAGGYIDSADKIELLTEAIKTHEIVKNSFFYLFDFDNLSTQELSIIENLLKFSKGVTVACCANHQKGFGHLYLNDIANGVENAAKNVGCEVNIISSSSHTNAHTKQIGEYLFGFKQIQPMENDDFVGIFAGNTRVQEVYSLACQIQKFVRKGGRFRDVFVITSDISKYTNAVTTIFEQFEIPYFCDRQFCLADHALVQFVVDFLTMQKNNMQLEWVLNFTKNHFFGQDANDVFLFENYCLKYNINYSFDEFSLGKTTNPQQFESAEKIRLCLKEICDSVQINSSDSVRNYIFQIYSLVEKCNLWAKNTQFAQIQAQQNLAFESKVSSQVEEKFVSILSQIEDILGDRILKLEDFIKILRSALSSANISAIPMQNDCVVFANMAKARKHDIKFLALLGANQGHMPIFKSDCKLLNDTNIAELNSAGIFLEPQIAVENKRERFSLYQLLQEPSQKLYISYTQTDGTDSLLPSPFVNQIRQMFFEKGKPIENLGADEEVYTLPQAISKIVLNLRKLADNQQVNMADFSILYRHFRQQADQFKFSKAPQDLYIEKGKQLFLHKSQTSVSKITDFFKCPHKFFLNYGIGIKPREVSELNSSKLGEILHSVLEQFVREIDTSQTDGDTIKQAQKFFELTMQDDFLRGLANDASMKNLLKLLQEEATKMCLVIKNQLKNSKFACYATEYGFGGDHTANGVEVQFDGGSFLLNGIVDRVDTFGDKFVVIDYKSGGSAANYSEKDLYIGQKLQLLVYLKAVRQNLKLKPVGFYYFSLHNKFSSEKEKKIYTYGGRTLSNVEIAKAIDANLQNGFSETLGLRLTKAGELWKTPSIVTQNQLDSQIDYATKLIARAGQLMQKGYVAIKPYEDVCDYCDFCDICDFNDVFTYKPRKQTTPINAETIEQNYTASEGEKS